MAKNSPVSLEESAEWFGGSQIEAILFGFVGHRIHR